MTHKVVLASSNAGKLRELRSLLAPCDFEVLAQSDFNIPDADETGLTFVENAILKARNACEHSGLPAIADDSGLEVDALNGQPGIYSARFSNGWQGQPANDARNNQYLLEQLLKTTDDQRTARYQCVLVYMRHSKDPTPIICQGTWEGKILHQLVGENGFGYDPLFYIPEHNCSSAQLSKDVKNSISHRAIALKALIASLKQSTIKPATQ